MVAVAIADQSMSQPRSVPDAARRVVTVRKIGLARALRALANEARDRPRRASPIAQAGDHHHQAEPR